MAFAGLENSSLLQAWGKSTAGVYSVLHSPSEQIQGSNYLIFLMPNIYSDYFDGPVKFIISQLTVHFFTRHSSLLWFAVAFFVYFGFWYFLITKPKNFMHSEGSSSKQILNIARFAIKPLKLLTLKFTSIYNLSSFFSLEI